MILLSIFAGIVAGVLLAPTLSDLVSLAKIAFGRGAERPACRPQELPRFLFLVPAHNEESLIASCVESLRSMRYPAGCVAIWVIADNCSDRTSTLARRAGARCLKRHEPRRPGKPQAIAWALERLPVRDFDAVVIIDADVVVDGAFAAGVARAAPLRGKVVQPYNGVRNPSDNALTRMAAVLSAANHQFAFGLKTRAGLNVPLGAGVSFGSEVLACYGWGAFSIGEDWELYALMTEQGVRTESSPQARLYAEEARSLRQSASQRHRWAAGKLTVLFRYAGRLLRSRHIGPHQKLDAVAELLGTGPAVHLGLVTALAAALLMMNAPAAPGLAIALAVSVLRPATYTLVALAREPDPWRKALAFSYLPFYTLWRIGVQLTALTMLGDKPWIRTERNR